MTTHGRSKILDAGCFILQERIPEAFEPEWRELLNRIYMAMRRAHYGHKVE